MGGTLALAIMFHYVSNLHHYHIGISNFDCSLFFVKKTGVRIFITPAFVKSLASKNQKIYSNAATIACTASFNFVFANALHCSFVAPACVPNVTAVFFGS